MLERALDEGSVGADDSFGLDGEQEDSDSSFPLTVSVSRP